MKFRWLIRQKKVPFISYDDVADNLITEYKIESSEPVLQSCEEYGALMALDLWKDVPVVTEPPKNKDK